MLCQRFISAVIAAQRGTAKQRNGKREVDHRGEIDEERQIVWAIDVGAAGRNIGIKRSET